MKRFVVRAAFILAVAAIAIPWQTDVAAQPKTKDAPPKRSPVMVRKLEHAQNLLHGLAVQDFDLLTRSSDELIKCREETTWRLNDTEKYEFYSNMFLEHLLSVKAAAKKKDIEAATLAYVGVARSCIKCHEQLRPDRGDRKDD